MMEPTCSVIDDGYTREGYLEGRDRLHDPLSFAYRPMLPADLEEADDEMKKLPSRQRMSYMCNRIAERLVRWSECERDAAGKPDQSKPRPITPGNVGRLNYSQLSDLRWVIWGISAGDPIPNATPEQESELMRAMRAELAGKPPGLEQVALDQKN